MKPLLLSLVAGLALAVPASGAILIPVPNGSFENPDVAGGDLAAPTDWTPGFDVLVQNENQYNGPAAAEGGQYVGLGAFGGFTNLFIDLPAGLSDPDVVSYTLTAAFAVRGSEGAGNAGDVVLGLEDRSGDLAGNATTFSRGSLSGVSFTDVSVTLSAATVAGGDTLRLYIDKLSGTEFVVVDDVRLVANLVPEPASLALLAAGGLAVLRRRG